MVAASAPVTALRPEEMLAKPVVVDPAFDEPERVLALFRDSAPYRLAAAVHRSHASGKDVPWFRVFWAYGEKLADPRADFIFQATLCHEGGGWVLVDGDTRRELAEDAIRLSVLWKAYAFEDEVAVRVFRDKSDDLTLPKALSILSDDLDRRGVGRLDVDAGYGDADNRRLIHQTYRAPRVNDARRRAVE